MKKIQNSEPVKQKIKAGEKNAPRKKAPFQSWRVKNEEKLFEHSHSDDKLMSSGMRNVSREPLTKEEIDFVADELKGIVERLRSMSPLYEDFIKKEEKKHVQ